VDDLPEDAVVIDPVMARPVTVSDRVLMKIARTHVDIGRIRRHEVFRAIATADLVVPHPWRLRGVVYFRSGMGPSRWLCVAVQYDEDMNGVVRTAFARTRLPGWA
jgi:hypothetical protein